MEYLSFREERLPLIGFGTWRVGENPSREQDEIATMKYGIENMGLTLIDTAEMYGYGGSEKVVGKLLQETDRNSLFLVDKIMPGNAVSGDYEEYCLASLKRLGISQLDLYLLHWRGGVDLQKMVDEMERLAEKGLIKHWGVSNFDVEDMEELFRCRNGNHCFANQVLYNLSCRGIEYDLLPWCREHQVLLMAYSPLGNNRADRERMTSHPAVQKIAEKYQMTEEAVLLQFVTRDRDVVAIFKTASIEHLRRNMSGEMQLLDEEDMRLLNATYPAPNRKVPLDII